MHILFFYSTWFLLFLSFSGLRIEINLYDNREALSKIARAVVICTSVTSSLKSNSSPENEEKNLRLSNYDLEYYQGNPSNYSYIPDITINSTERYRCKLVTPAWYSTQEQLRTTREQLSKRVLRELTDSIPAEFGNCRSGYRLEKNMCFPCPPGTYSSGQEAKCLPCPRNYFNSRYAADHCDVCPEGGKTLDPGADSDGLCLYIVNSGQADSRLSTKMMIILICVLIFVIFAWIVIIVLLCCWKRREKIGKTAETQTEKSPLMAEDDEPVYESITDIGSDESHAYAEIGDIDGVYEEPIKPDKDQHYIDLISDENYYDKAAESNKKKSDIKKLAEIIVHGPKSGSEKQMKGGILKKPSDKDREVKKVSLLLKDIFQTPEPVVESSATSEDQVKRQSQPAKDMPNKSMKRRIKSVETQKTKSRNIKDVVQTKESDFRSSLESKESNILDEPNLQDAIDSRIFLGDDQTL